MADATSDACAGMSQRDRSLRTYHAKCPVSGKLHDWRYASDAPGWITGDLCVRCEVCKDKAIAHEDRH